MGRLGGCGLFQFSLLGGGNKEAAFIVLVAEIGQVISPALWGKRGALRCQHSWMALAHAGCPGEVRDPSPIQASALRLLTDLRPPHRSRRRRCGSRPRGLCRSASPQTW